MLGEEAYVLSKKEIKKVKDHSLPIKSSGFPWPPDLIAFWDFDEPDAPYIAKAGVDKFPLNVGGTAPTQVSAKPFGKGLKFNGAGDYLKIPAEDVGALNVAKSGDEVTVVAWVKRPNTSSGHEFIAGMWQEDDNNPMRQYGLFSSLPAYGGLNRVCGHVSRTGGPSPNIVYSRDYSASGAMIDREVLRCIGFTYDGEKALSYVDGISDLRTQFTERNDAPKGEGLTYSKNPYIFDLGLNRNNIADFTVGSVLLTRGMDNYFNGVLSGLAVFRRALTPYEMMKIHLDSLDVVEPIQYFDFCSDEIVGGNMTVGEFGWNAARNNTANDGSFINLYSWRFTRVGTITGKPFAFISSEGSAEPQKNKNYPNLLTKTGFKALRLSQIGKVQFTLNNNSPLASIKFCIKLNGVWYATSENFSHAGNGLSGSDWSTSEIKTHLIERGKEDWLILNYELGEVLELGTAPMDDLQNGEVTGIGLLANPLQETGVVLRVADLKLYS